MERLYILSLVFLFIQSYCFSQDDNAFVRLHKTEIQFSNNSVTKRVWVKLQINNRAGDIFTQFKIPYSSILRIRNLEASIKTVDGEIIRKLKKAEIKSKSQLSESAFYEDQLVYEFNLKHNIYPYIVEYSYEEEAKEFLYIDFWVPVLNINIPTQEAILTISASTKDKFNYKYYDAQITRADTLNNTTTVTWASKYSGNIKPMLFGPELIEYLPRVYIIPEKFKFKTEGQFTNWTTYGNWQYELLIGLDELPESEKRVISSLIRNVQSEKEKIRILYHYLQDNTRYINVSIETGGMHPYPAQYVAFNKYGDCKALSNYFKSILKYAGIKSYYTNVYGGKPSLTIDTNFVSQQFNHAILYIPTKDEDIWLDCTSDGPFNYLGTFTQNRPIFIIDENNSRFEQTPSLTKNDVTQLRKINIQHSEFETQIELNYNIRGELFENLLMANQIINNKNQIYVINELFASSDYNIEDFHIQKQHRDSTFIIVQINGKSDRIYKKYGNEIVGKNIEFDLPPIEHPNLRTLPFQLDFPIHKIDTIIYKIPDTYKIKYIEKQYQINSAYGSYRYEITANDDSIKLVKQLHIQAQYINVKEYPQFYEFYNQILEIENKKPFILN